MRLPVFKNCQLALFHLVLIGFNVFLVWQILIQIYLYVTEIGDSDYINILKSFFFFFLVQGTYIFGHLNVTWEMDSGLIGPNKLQILLFLALCLTCFILSFLLFLKYVKWLFISGFCTENYEVILVFLIPIHVTEFVLIPSCFPYLYFLSSPKFDSHQPSGLQSFINSWANF